VTATVDDALAVLASLPDSIACSLGGWVNSQTGEFGGMCSREDWREGLLEGNVAPDRFIQDVRAVGFLRSPAGLDYIADASARLRRRKFTVVTGEAARRDDR
jgi:hypothetical protein